VVVEPEAEHPLMVLDTQIVWVIVATELLVPPGISDVENEIVCVHSGTTVLPVHDEEDDDRDKEVDVMESVELGPVDDCVDVGSSSGSSKAWPTAAKLSVKFSTRSMSSVLVFTESTKLFTTFVAQLRSLATS